MQKPARSEADRVERSLFVSLGMMLFCGLFSYQLLQMTKDTILIDACGAEAITFVKVYGVLPASMVFLSLHSRLERTALDGRPRSDTYVKTAVPFIAFFALFGAVLYPLKDVLHPKRLPDLPDAMAFLSQSESLRSVRLLARHWTFALFYVLSELYGNVSVSILFWQFANQVVSMRQARGLYPELARFTWIAPVLAGQAVVLADRMFGGNFVNSMRAITLLVVLASSLMVYLHTVALAASRELARIRPEPMDPSISVGRGRRGGKAGTKRKPGLFQSIGLVSSSPYLVCVAVLVIAYGLCMNFTEVIWKTSLRRCFPDLNSYQRFLGWFATALGISVFGVSLLAPVLLRLFGWQKSALVVPSVMGALALPLYLAAGRVEGDLCSKLAVVAGSVHNLASKSLKFAVFDPTKNMAYLPLSPEIRGAGQAAIDVLGGRLGKSGAALLQQMVIVFCGGEIVRGVRVIGFMYACATLAWVWAINSLAPKLPAKLLRRAEAAEAA
ncbi:ADP/ATP carrier protein [Pavlovales sp. CCMP2436]|nr:ADP/ATP carrier protein [Pavlovales sp. CCMP2436]